MSPKAQRHPRGHRVSTGRGTISSGLEFVSHNAPGEASTATVARGGPSGGTWSSVVSGGRYSLAYCRWLAGMFWNVNVQLLDSSVPD